MIFRKAEKNDARAIANLHAENWRNTYRGILSDKYLDEDVFEERNAVWQARFAQPKDNQYVMVAQKDDKLAGFVCVLGDEDAEWGSLIDNLHVHPDLKGQGIGKRLIQEAMDWLHENYPKTAIHLWVFEENMRAKKFYEAMGGIQKLRVLHHNEDGTEGYALMYVW